MMDTPAIGRGLVMQAMIVARKMANICQPATVMVAGRRGVSRKSPIPMIKGQMKPL